MSGEERARRGEEAAAAALVFGVAAALVGVLGAVDVLSWDFALLAVPTMLSGILAGLAVISGLVAFARRTPERVEAGVAVALGLLTGAAVWLLIPRLTDRF